VIGIQEVTPSWHSSALMTNMKVALDATDHSPVFVDPEL
jgi:hypothetical protein